MHRYWKEQYFKLHTLHERVKAADRRQKHAIVAFFSVIILGMAVFGGIQYVAYTNLKNRPEKPCPIIVVNKTVPATAPAVTPTATAKPAAKPAVNIKLLFFMEDGCPFCEQQAPAIADIAKTHNVTTYNLTTDPNGNALVSQWGLKTTPTVVILKNGKEVTRFTTVTDEATILRAMS